MGIAAEQLLNGMYTSYILLAMPLFILAAELMNIGSLTDRLLSSATRWSGRFRGGLGHVNIVAKRHLLPACRARPSPTPRASAR